jgi:putative membrane protein
VTASGEKGEADVPANLPRVVTRPGEPALLLGAALLLLAWSGVQPLERGTWLLEVFPVLLAAPLLVATRARFPLTPLLYRLLFLHAVVLVIGGHYTYARVPLGFWAQDLLDLSRNHYDRLGHLMQGFVPAILAREILLRTSPLRRGRWLFFVVTCVCLAFSAFYELIEWWAALLGGASAESFLGTQGDVWDTQWDMFLALCGAVSAQLLLARAHDLSLVALGVGGDPAAQPAAGRNARPR